MPASLEEIELVQTEGILFKELLSPMSIKDSKLICEEMKLGKKMLQEEENLLAPVILWN